jgi:hypothetical protein
MTTAGKLSATARWGRAAITSAVALVLAVVAHVSGGGLLPGPVWLVVLASVTWLVSARILSRPASTPRIVALVVVAQSAAHVFLSATAGHGSGRPTRPVETATSTSGGMATVGTLSDAGPRTGSLRDLTSPGSGVGSGGSDLALPSWLTHLPQELSGPNAVMALAHIAAAVVLGLWLAMGERSLWALVALVGPSSTVVRRHIQRLAGALAALGRRLLTGPTLLGRSGFDHRSAWIAPLGGLPGDPHDGHPLRRRGPPATA